MQRGVAHVAWLGLTVSAALLLATLNAVSASKVAPDPANADAARPDAARRAADGEPSDSASRPPPPATQPSTPPAAITADTSELSEAALQLSSGLVDSAHDFTGNGRVGRNLCMPCHTPHLVDAPAPLLDQRREHLEPLQPFETNALVLDGWSLMCLGCHDGVSASDVFTSAHATTLTARPGGLRTDGEVTGHPVGVAYPQRLPGYAPRARVEQAGLPLPEGRIQCVTCHNPHNTGRHAGMLQISNQRSRLCLTCHEL